MAKRNITLSLPEELIREAKIQAAQRAITINALVRELLERQLSAKTHELAPGRLFLELAKQGPYSNVDPGSTRREDLHERR